MKSISILGCGWLGFPLAKFLVGQNYLVNGSTTNSYKFEQLRKDGISPFIIKLDPNLEDYKNFLETETLVINFPPPRVENKIEFHLSQINSILTEAEKKSIKNIIFISSTSVYNNSEKFVTEETIENPQTESGKALEEVEKLLQSTKEFKTTIVRFGGLIGYDRQPAKFLAGRKNIPNGGAPVNLIHQDDCINIIYKIIEKEIWGDIFNACMDEHPTKKDFYSTAAEKLGLELPHFSDENSTGKLITNDKIKSALNYTFKYSNPLDTI